MGIKKYAAAFDMIGGLMPVRIVLAAICCLPAIASGATFGDWQTGVTTNGKTYYAYTQNDSSQVFGEWCSLESGYCTWMIGMSVTCDTDSAYPLLANSDSGADSLSIKCGGTIEDTNLSRYSFTDFKSVTNLLKGAHVVGFALPMQSDQFRVVRFSLAGSSDAISAMEAVATAALKHRKSGATDTVDQTL